MRTTHHQKHSVETSVVTSNSRIRRIRYRDHEGGYRSLNCGRIPKEDCDIVLCHVRHLVRIKRQSRPCRPSTLEWINGEGQAVAEQLRKHGVLKFCV